jgi:hypothetical protein
MPPYRTDPQHDAEHPPAYTTPKLLEFAHGMWLIVSVSFVGIAIWFSLS